ncbi:hypothetical protein CALVIDRAFT_226617 [Calocera viscosa TUFC12733]|uniref:Uncharacterized protein n=1 Tax=Calocera viscosa (strain TUFC12733) TaxID=1330018 RepID=A0A167K1K3_CALVF|nr:hypothetical protein CALVIDRAFT_226617 [Calocera viscosa TUFC12733]
MNEHVSIHHSETEEPSTYTKSILLHDDRSPSSRRTGSVDSYATSEGTSYYDDSSPNEPAPLSTVLEHEPKMNGTGLGINGGMKRDESTVTVASSPSSEIEGDAPPAEDIGEGLDAAKEPGPTTAPPLAGALASRMAYVGGALAPRAGPPSPPLLIIPGANSLPNSPDPSRITSIQARRLTIPHSMTPGNSPASPLSGRRGFSRPDIGDLPSSSSMRITPAVLLTPVVPRPLTLFPLPPVTPIIGEDAEQQARRARRIVPVLMSPGVQEDQEGGGSSSPGTSDDEGEESDGTSEEGTSTEGDARSTRSSSEGSSNIAISEGAGPPARERTESTATSWSTATAHTLRRRGSTGQPMTSIMAAMAPLTRPTTSAESDETQRPDGTPTPGPSKDMKAKERDYFTSKSPTPNAGTERSPLHTPKPKSSTRARGVTDVDGRPRPGLYHQKSQSLVDLTADTRKVILPEAAPKAPKPQTIPEDEVLVPKPVATLKRQTSLPAVNPPAYSPPHPHSVVGRSSAREEEGKEKLPTYSCGVHIEGTLQRKMEFSAPGVQARDRSGRDEPASLLPPQKVGECLPPLHLHRPAAAILLQAHHPRPLADQAYLAIRPRLSRPPRWR